MSYIKARLSFAKIAENLKKNLWAIPDDVLVLGGIVLQICVCRSKLHPEEALVPSYNDSLS